MIWVSTGHGSVSRNWFAHNRAVRPRFGGLAGTDQNVGEMILLEACQRYIYSGPVEDADSGSVTLPQSVERTPDETLGTVSRFVLPVDGRGHETPFWPPDAKDDDGVGEPPVGEYYVVVLRGRGMGQSRRVVSRQGERLVLESPWEPPTKGDRILVTTLFHRNLIVGNDVQEGMSGIQLWFSCMENVVSGNAVRHQRGGGLPLVGSVSTLASSMPTMWNRGLAPCFFNTFEGNLTEDVTNGGSAHGGASHELPRPDFPIAMGNVYRHNSLTSNRIEGMTISGDRRESNDVPASTVGTIFELNIVRDSPGSLLRVAGGADLVVARRNIFHFWHPAEDPNEKRAAMVFDQLGTYFTEINEVESRYAGRDTVLRERYLWKEAKPTPPQSASKPSP